MTSVNWWARRWENLMQEWGIAVAEAKSNRAYRVKSLEVVPGAIEASVHDRDAGACKVEVRFETLPDAQWDRIGELLSNQPLVSSQLLSNAMPPEIEQVFVEAGGRLLPTRSSELTTTCTICGSGQCRHLPLVFSLFAEMLDNDPGLLFTLRGRELQRLLREVHDARSPATNATQNGANNGHVEHQTPLAAPSLASEIEQYWGNRALMRQFHHHIAPPAVELALLRRLGPISASDDAMGVYEQLVALYRRITEEALALAYSSDDEPAPTSNGNGNGYHH